MELDPKAQPALQDLEVPEEQEDLRDLLAAQDLLGRRERRDRGGPPDLKVHKEKLVGICDR